MCKQTKTLVLNPDDWIKYEHGALVQDAFPYLTNEERESLVSGIWDPCWAKMFDNDE